MILFVLFLLVDLIEVRKNITIVRKSSSYFQNIVIFRTRDGPVQFTRPCSAVGEKSTWFTRSRTATSCQ